MFLIGCQRRFASIHSLLLDAFFRIAVSIEPNHTLLLRKDISLPIHKSPILGDREIGSAIANHRPDVLGDGKGIAAQLEAIGIEALRHESALTNKNEIPRWRVNGV